jgi:hypothetical protein
MIVEGLVLDRTMGEKALTEEAKEHRAAAE